MAVQDRLQQLIQTSYPFMSSQGKNNQSSEGYFVKGLTTDLDEKQ